MIGILTFYWADDYGALLQAYALKTYLSKYQETVMIPYYPAVLRSRYHLIQYSQQEGRLRKGYGIVRGMLDRRFRSDFMAKCKISRFRGKYLTGVRECLNDSKEIYEFDRHVDTYVVGSDQVWNPEITEGFQEGYFCTFRLLRGEEARYIAYAPSIGSERLEERYSQQLLELLTNFDEISLREPSAMPYMKELYEGKLSVVLDPVFLLKKKEWERLIRTKRRIKKNYIAVYYTEYNQAMAEYLQCLEKNTGMHVLVLKPKQEDVHWTDNQVFARGCGLSEFLEWMYYAPYVVTNSFHGTALSVIFHKQFAVFPHSVRNARISDLLEMLDLKKRMVDTREIVLHIDETIDWKKADEALKEEVKVSKEFIRKEICNSSRVI